MSLCRVDPLATNLVGKTCPLSNGRYYTTYSAGPGEEDKCIGDTNSVAVVSGDTIEFDTCGTGDTQSTLVTVRAKWHMFY